MTSFSPLPVALKVVLLCGVAVLAQQSRERPVPPIPAVEQFVQGTGLRIRLTVRSTSLDAFANPGFKVIFENVGNTPAHLHPWVIPNIRIYDDGGTLVAPAITIVCECQPRQRIRNEDLIQIPPGGSWTIALPPEYPRYRYRDERASYMFSRPGSENGLLLPGGRYTARFTYVNLSGGLDPLEQYDVRELRDVWEGRQESEPVSFSVAPGAESVFQELFGTPETRSWLLREQAVSSREVAKQLVSDDRKEVENAVRIVRTMRWKSSVPALVAFLDAEPAWKRQLAVWTLKDLGVEGLHDRMRSLVNDPDPSVGASALEYLLFRECDLRDLPELERPFGPMDNIATAYVNCGDASTFLKLRSFLTLDRRCWWASSALNRLTFRPGRPDVNIPTITPAEWDAWYATHRRESREQWAVTALREPERPGSQHTLAFDYLRRQNNRRWLGDFRRGVTSDWYSTRIAAARGIAQFERAEGIALLRRELNHRSVDACSRAVDALNSLTGQHLDFDFTVPLERQRAMEAYSSASSR